MAHVSSVTPESPVARHNATDNLQELGLDVRLLSQFENIVNSTPSIFRKFILDNKSAGPVPSSENVAFRQTSLVHIGKKELDRKAKIQRILL
jgi:hypothetical protein